MHPFVLTIERLPNAERSLTISQQPYPARQNGRSLPYAQTGAIDGLALASAWDIILAELRASHHTPTSIQRKKRFGLSEQSGVRLSLLFQALASLADLDQIRAIQQGVWAMSDEEAYYWFAKCRQPNGIRALRVLFEVVQNGCTTVVQ